MRRVRRHLCSGQNPRIYIWSSGAGAHCRRTHRGLADDFQRASAAAAYRGAIEDSGVHGRHGEQPGGVAALAENHYAAADAAHAQRRPEGAQQRMAAQHRSAPRAGTARVHSLLPARSGPGHAQDCRPRGAHPLAASRARPGAPHGLHSRRRRIRHDSAHRRLGPGRGLPPDPGLEAGGSAATPRCASASTFRRGSFCAKAWPITWSRCSSNREHPAANLVWR